MILCLSGMKEVKIPLTGSKCSPVVGGALGTDVSLNLLARMPIRE